MSKDPKAYRGEVFKIGDIDPNGNIITEYLPGVIGPDGKVIELGDIDPTTKKPYRNWQDVADDNKAKATADKAYKIGAGGGWKVTAKERVGNETRVSYTSADGTTSKTEMVPVPQEILDQEHAAQNMALYSGIANKNSINQNILAGQVQVQSAKNYEDQRKQTAGLAGTTWEAQNAEKRLPASFGNQAANSQISNAIDRLSSYSQGAVSGQLTDSYGALSGYDQGSVIGQLGDSYDSLRAYADAGIGESAAQAQLDQALGQNTATQFALAQSGRNAGENAANYRQAMFQASDMGQKTAAEKASLRAQETQQYEANKLAALNAAGSIAGNLESATQARNAQGLSALNAAAGVAGDIESAEQARNAQTLSALQASGQLAASQYGASIGADAQAAAAKQTALSQLAGLQQQGYAQTAASGDVLTAGYKDKAAINSAASGMSLSAAQAATGSQQAYDNALLTYKSAGLDRLASTNEGKASRALQSKLAQDAENERNTDRYIGAVGAGLGVLGSVYGS